MAAIFLFLLLVLQLIQFSCATIDLSKADFNNFGHWLQIDESSLFQNRSKEDWWRNKEKETCPVSNSIMSNLSFIMFNTFRFPKVTLAENLAETLPKPNICDSSINAPQISASSAMGGLPYNPTTPRILTTYRIDSYRSTTKVSNIPVSSTAARMVHSMAPLITPAAHATSMFIGAPATESQSDVAATSKKNPSLEISSPFNAPATPDPTTIPISNIEHDSQSPSDSAVVTHSSTGPTSPISSGFEATRSLIGKYN